MLTTGVCGRLFRICILLFYTLLQSCVNASHGESSVLLQINESFKGLVKSHVNILHAEDSVDSGRERPTMFMHFHMEKTGGTTVSNIILDTLCGEQSEGQGWDARCSRTCPNALVDTELSCMSMGEDGRDGEHMFFSDYSKRTKRFQDYYDAGGVLFLTTLRPGWQRIISQWYHVITQKSWLPPAGIEQHSNESLLHYLRGKPADKSEWGLPFPKRNNLQVAELGSVEDGDVTEADLERVKKMISTEPWLVGFPECIGVFQDRLAQLANTKAPDRAIDDMEKKTPDDLYLSAEVVQELKESTKFDNELYEWALDQSVRMKGNFAGPCSDAGSSLSGGGSIVKHNGKWRTN